MYGVSQPNWVTVKNTHEAIIAQADFDIVADRLRQDELRRSTFNRHTNKELPENILKGLIFCAECGRAYQRMAKTKPDNVTYRITYLCRYCNQNNPNYNSKRHFKQDELYDAIYEVIRHHMELCGDICSKIRQFVTSEYSRNKKSELDGKIQSIQRKIERVSVLKLELYNDLHDDVINGAEYALLNDRYDIDKSALLSELEQFSHEKKKLRPEFVSQNKRVSSLEQFAGEKTLTREMLTALVERIEVGFNRSLEITLRYRDEYERLLAFARESGVQLREQ